MPGAERRGVFLSYRRDDAGPYARSLQLQLSQRIPDARIFMDLDSIEPGLDFAEVIEEAVNSSAVLVALIGRQWVTLTGEDGARRLDNPDDYVRFEVTTALERGVRVIPVLIDGARALRRQDLPAELHKLARLNAAKLSYDRYQDDADRLLDLIQRVLATVGEEPLAEEERQLLDRKGGEKADRDLGSLAAAKPPSEPRSRSGTGLSSLLMPELQRMAQSMGIEGAGRMRRGQLIEAIQNRQGRWSSRLESSSLAETGAEQRREGAGSRVLVVIRFGFIYKDQFGYASGPLRPESKYRRLLPASQPVWPAADRPWMSADVRRWPWRLSLTSSLSRRVCADGCWPDGNGDCNDGEQVDRCTGAQGQHESTLLSRQPRGCKASVLWIDLWMLRQTGWSTTVKLWTSGAVEKWITVKKPALPSQVASAVHKRNEISAVQLVSSVIPATSMPADLLLSSQV